MMRWRAGGPNHCKLVRVVVTIRLTFAAIRGGSLFSKGQTTFLQSFAVSVAIAMARASSGSSSGNPGSNPQKRAQSPLPSTTVPYAMQNRNFIISSSTLNLRSSHTAKPLKPAFQGKKCMLVMPTPEKGSYDYLITLERPP